MNGLSRRFDRGITLFSFNLYILYFMVKAIVFFKFTAKEKKIIFIQIHISYLSSQNPYYKNEFLIPKHCGKFWKEDDFL